MVSEGLKSSPQPLHTMSELSDGIAAAARAALLDTISRCPISPIIDAGSPKLPPFDPEDSELWYETTEEEFQLKGISADSTKYPHALPAIDSSSRQFMPLPLGDPSLSKI